MSTSFEVKGRTGQMPTIGEFLAATHEVLLDRCKDAGLSEAPGLSLKITSIKGESFTPSPDMKLQMHKAYGTLTIDGTDTGCYVETRGPVDQFQRDYWVECYEENRASRPNTDLLELCEAPGFMWIIKRYIGDSRFLCCIAAGALARLTQGGVFSDDGAWDYKRMPLTGEEFLAELDNPGDAGRGIPDLSTLEQRRTFFRELFA